MAEHPSPDDLNIVDDLLDLIPRLLQRIRADIFREAEAEENGAEWHDVSELRATNGQVRLLRILTTRSHCTMQELADQLNVAPPTVTSMIKRLLTLGFVERLRDEQDWRVVRISLTERGHRAVTLYDRARRANLQHRMTHLNQEELAHLRLALPVLRYLIEVEP
jgi:MarR family transcriptional regulator, organic hydroperoxide resistance regulator